MLFKTTKDFYFLDSTTFTGYEENVKSFVGFLRYEKTRLFAFDIS